MFCLWDGIERIEGEMKVKVSKRECEKNEKLMSNGGKKKLKILKTFDVKTPLLHSLR